MWCSRGCGLRGITPFTVPLGGVTTLACSGFVRDLRCVIKQRVSHVANLGQLLQGWCLQVQLDTTLTHSLGTESSCTQRREHAGGPSGLDYALLYTSYGHCLVEFCVPPILCCSQSSCNHCGRPWYNQAFGSEADNKLLSCSAAVVINGLL